jgi:response regulator RpfG family c-di-GMP phosphodiesterase
MKKLLITDDIKPVLEKEESILSRQKIEVLTASSGEDFSRIHGDEKVDLIIMNLKMSGMDGDEVCTNIRNNDSLKKVSIIIICDDDKLEISRCQACGANAFITNPVDNKEIFRHIKKFLYVAERKDIRIIFQVFIKGQNKDRFFFANSENISNSGILIVTDEVIEKGDKATCSFFLDQEMITLDGKIMRVFEKENNMFSYGIQFININLSTQKKLEEFINKS